MAYETRSVVIINWQKKKILTLSKHKENINRDKIKQRDGKR
jgi:hypothetical protein